MKYDSIRPGRLWLDTNGRPIQAHGFSVFYDEKENRFVWYGENKEFTKKGGTVWTYGIRYAGGPGGDFDELLDPLPGFPGGVVLEEGPDLHDERDLSRGEEFLRSDGRDESQRDQKIRLDVVLENDTLRRAHEDRDAAEDDGDPRDIDGQDVLQHTRDGEDQRDGGCHRADERHLRFVFQPVFEHRMPPENI
jgi:hypothetical protein